MFSPPHMPCSDCGASIERGKEEEHERDPERKREYETFQFLRDEMALFDEELDEFFALSDTQLDAWLAAKEREEWGEAT